MSRNPAYAILRVHPLKSWSAVSAMARHGRREGAEMAHVDRARSALNRHGSDWCDEPRDLRRCMEAVRAHHGAQNRKGAPVGSHVLVTASGSYFRPECPDALGTWNTERLEGWLAANLAWFRQRWPEQVAAYRLDLDEATPHLDVFLVPVARRRTRGGREKCEVSHREAFGKSRKSFAELQNAYADAMAPLGLSRGRPRSVTHAVHVHPAVLRRQMNRDAETQRALKVGTSGILRRDVGNLRLRPDGSLSADFAGRVPAGAHGRFLALMRPAAPTLIRFERHLGRTVKRFANEVLDAMVDVAEADRQESAELLKEARWLQMEFSRHGVFTPAGLNYQLERLARELVR